MLTVLIFGFVTRFGDYAPFLFRVNLINLVALCVLNSQFSPRLRRPGTLVSRTRLEGSGSAQVSVVDIKQLPSKVKLELRSFSQRRVPVLGEVSLPLRVNNKEAPVGLPDKVKLQRSDRLLLVSGFIAIAQQPSNVFGIRRDFSPSPWNNGTTTSFLQ
ncbi:hypothetical protein Ciccas_007528 [Cichlidogyrus casuarinus]|uniref:Uncharacterized protein n=1 Tax=Cichlidogyrus casuarinus TaxID=1844966 RepID=A0ABD2Q2N8_9PLAT